MTEFEIKQDISFLYNVLHKRYTKYLRNYARYVNNGLRTVDLSTFTEQPLSFWYPGQEDDQGATPTMNVLASAIKTKVSKMAQTKVRPFFNPVNGTFQTRQVVRNAQIFFDDFFTRQDVYKKGSLAYRDAQIFDYGILWADDDDATIKNVKPWEFYIDPAEYHYGKPTRCFLHFRNYPKTGLGKEDLPSDRCELVIYWDLKAKKKYRFMNKELLSVKSIDYDEIPFSFVFYEQPVKGFQSLSLIDNSLPTQRIIDLLNARIAEAATLTPANFILIPESNGIKASAVDNKVGNVYTYKPTAAGGKVEVVTPSFVSNQYIDALQMYEQKIYAMEGISQLSAQAKKPSGVTAGVALQTLDDLESERFQTELQQMIALYMDITSKCISTFDDNAEILPKRYGRASIKWKDIKRERDLINIQFSATSSLSKDPQTKLEQIEKLQAMQLINPSVAASLLEMPDLEGGYSIMTASYDDCQKIIERAVMEERYDFYEVVNLEQLLSEVGNTILRLDAVDEDQKTMERLVVLFAVVKGKMDSILPPPPPPAPPMPPLPPPMPIDPTLGPIDPNLPPPPMPLM